MATPKLTDAQKAIMRQKALADQRAVAAALAADERLAASKVARTAIIATVDADLADATAAYRAAVEDLAARVGQETVATLLGPDAIPAPPKRGRGRS